MSVINNIINELQLMLLMNTTVSSTLLSHPPFPIFHFKQDTNLTNTLINSVCFVSIIDSRHLRDTVYYTSFCSPNAIGPLFSLVTPRATSQPDRKCPL